jgi:hypothetical protein
MCFGADVAHSLVRLAVFCRSKISGFRRPIAIRGEIAPGCPSRMAGDSHLWLAALVVAAQLLSA